MTDPELYDLLRLLEQGTRSTDQVYDKIIADRYKRKSESRLFWIWAFAVIMLLAFFVDRCHQAV